MSLRRSASRAVALSAFLICVLTAPPARAEDGTIFLDDDLATYMEIAHRHWGGPIPTCVANGVTVIPVHALLYDDPDPDVAARAEQPGCRLWLDRGSWRRMSPVEACMVVVHEWGHLLGHGHSDDPLDPMAELPVRPPPGCRTLAGRPRRARASGRRARACAAHSPHGGSRAAHRRSRAARHRAGRSACLRHLA